MYIHFSITIILFITYSLDLDSNILNLMPFSITENIRKARVPQGSVLGLLPFLLYIKDLNQAIKFCKVHHFADDNNLYIWVILSKNWTN